MSDWRLMKFVLSVIWAFQVAIFQNIWNVAILSIKDLPVTVISTALGLLGIVLQIIWTGTLFLTKKFLYTGGAGETRVHVMVLGKTFDSHKEFMKRLGIRSQHEVLSVAESDVIFAFVPIVSRAGTDIEAALQKIPGSRPVILVVLHYTFDRYFTAPESRCSIKRSEIFTVDCLYHEERGLLQCPQNKIALKQTANYISIIKKKKKSQP